MKTQYQLTYLYKALLTVDVKAESVEQAVEIGKEGIENVRSKVGRSKDVNLENDSFNPISDGIINMDATWNKL